MNLHEAMAAYRSDKPLREEHGVILPDDAMYVPDNWGRNFNLALDALPTLATTANSGIPAFLSTFVDPTVYEILFAPNKAAIILGEKRVGDWVMDTAMFPTVEQTGEVSSYSDYANSGQAKANPTFPQRQAYMYQLIKQYGEREMARVALAKINWQGEIDKAANTIMAKFLNLVYFFGVNNLQNYGLINDPNLTASLTPSTKAAGGVTWFVNGVPNATANEVYNDVLALFQQVVNQTAGLVSMDERMCLAIPTSVMTALDFINTFGLVVRKMLKDSFPNMRIEQAVQYNQKTAANPQGVAGGNFIQLIVESVEGQDAGYCSFNEKMRMHPIIRELSAYKQKVSGGAWGAIIRMPSLISSMLGV